MALPSRLTPEEVTALMLQMTGIETSRISLPRQETTRNVESNKIITNKISEETEKVKSGGNSVTLYARTDADFCHISRSSDDLRKESPQPTIRLQDFVDLQRSLFIWQENVEDSKNHAVHESLLKDSMKDVSSSSDNFLAQKKKKLTMKRQAQNIIIRHPIHGHAFARVFSAYPKNCAACPYHVWSMISASCKCLLCNLLVHRTCCNVSEKLPKCPGYDGLTVDKEALQSYASLKKILNIYPKSSLKTLSPNIDEGLNLSAESGGKDTNNNIFDQEMQGEIDALDDVNLPSLTIDKQKEDNEERTNESKTGHANTFGNQIESRNSRSFLSSFSLKEEKQDKGFVEVEEMIPKGGRADEIESKLDIESMEIDSSLNSAQLEIITERKSSKSSSLKSFGEGSYLQDYVSIPNAKTASFLVGGIISGLTVAPTAASIIGLASATKILLPLAGAYIGYVFDKKTSSPGARKLSRWSEISMVLNKEVSRKPAGKLLVSKRSFKDKNCLNVQEKKDEDMVEVKILQFLDYIPVKGASKSKQNSYSSDDSLENSNNVMEEEENLIAEYFDSTNPRSKEKLDKLVKRVLLAHNFESEEVSIPGVLYFRLLQAFKSQWPIISVSKFLEENIDCTDSKNGEDDFQISSSYENKSKSPFNFEKSVVIVQENDDIEDTSSESTNGDVIEDEKEATLSAIQNDIGTGENNNGGEERNKNINAEKKCSIKRGRQGETGNDDDDDEKPPPCCCEDANQIKYELIISMIDFFYPYLPKEEEIVSIIIYAVESILFTDLYSIVFSRIKQENLNQSRQLSAKYIAFREERKHRESAFPGSGPDSSDLELLHLISSYKAPTDKLNLLIKILQTKPELALNADQLHAYTHDLILEAAVDNFPAHIAYIENFSIDNDSTGPQGYALAHFQNALMALLREDEAI